MAVRRVALAVAGLWVLWCAPLFGAEAPDASEMLRVAPRAADVEAPAWVRAGTRLLYTTRTFTIAGDAKEVYLDDLGQWIDGATGAPPPADGELAGFAAVDVGFVDRAIVQATVRRYEKDAQGRIRFRASSGIVANAGCAGDWWIHPEVLQGLQDLDQEGLYIARVTSEIDGRSFNALCIETDDVRGYRCSVYDLTTGQMLMFGRATPAGGAAVGRTMLTSYRLRRVREIDVPWRHAAPPSWVGQVKSIRYEGTQTHQSPGSPAASRAANLTLSTRSCGERWLRYASDLRIAAAAALPAEQHLDECSAGPGSLGAIWVGPELFAALAPGQVIDEDDLLKTKFLVTARDSAGITLSEVGDAHRIDHVYDPATGLLKQIKLTAQSGPTTITTQLSLTKKE
jgi:hypothetical protein